jgi:hypothetical protein
MPALMTTIKRGLQSPSQQEREVPSDFLKSKKTVEAASLSGPRVYSTDLLANHLVLTDVDGSVREAARALKIKILTKGVVVLNSSHLMDPLGAALVARHPDLLTGDGLLPAFRVGDSTFKVPRAESLPSYEAVGLGEKELADHLSFLERHVSQVMPWEIADVGEQFRQRLIGGLSADKSAITTFLLGVQDGEQWRDKLIGSFADLEMGRDRHLQEFVAELPGQIRERVDAYCQATYHLVGTTVVNCETGTDLSAMSSFKAESLVLANRDSSAKALTEEAIFLRAFLGHALELIQCALTPTAVIDAMSFADVHKVSEALRERGFQAKYDELLAAAVKAATSTDAVATMEEIDFNLVAETSRDIARSFQDYLDNEVGKYRPAEIDLIAGDALRAGADLGLDLVQMVPGVGSAVAVVKGGLNFAKSAGLSARAFALNNDSERAYRAANERRQEEFRAVVHRLGVSDKKRSELIDAASALADIHHIRTRRA